MSDFGLQLCRWRRGAGLGLRTFATLIDQRTSVVSAIENGQRGPWRDPAILARVARALGVPCDAPEYEQLLDAADDERRSKARAGRRRDADASGPALAHDDALLWWNSAAEAPLEEGDVDDLRRFLGVAADAKMGEGECARDETHEALDPLPLTELSIEWRARRTLGRRGHAAGVEPVDVEAALEDFGWQIIVVPGLLPRFSVGACAVRRAGGELALVVDRIPADVRPAAQYRLLLAATVAPAALADTLIEAAELARAEGSRRPCEQFALAMLLPSRAVSAAAEQAYRDLVAARGVSALELALREIRNRLATQLAAPAELVERRLNAWPCRVFDRVRLAIEAEEPTLPPLDWLPEWRPTRQQRLFT